MNKLKWLVLTVVGGAIALAGAIGAPGEVFADGGGWIGGGAPGLGSHGSGGGGGGGCSGIGGSYLLQCTGFSWIFYRSTGNVETEVVFRPDSNKSTAEVSRNARIDRACSEHTSEGGGFWHFGSNARGIKHSNGVFGYFGTFAYLNKANGGTSPDTFTYTSGTGAWGHMMTYNYGAMATYPWAGGSGDFSSQAPYVIPAANGSLNQTIYKDNVAVYEAEKYGTEREVLEAYSRAYENINGSEYDVMKGLPSDVYAFCAWDFAPKVEYLSSSNARSGSGNIAQTGIRKVETTKTATTLNLKVGDETEIVFSHNVYATEKANEVKWNMDRTVKVDGESKYGFFWSGYSDKYTIANEVTGVYEDTTNITTEYGGGEAKFIADKRNYVYGSVAYVTRDDYRTVKFKAAGTYEFCETMNVAGKKLTTACVKIVVTEKDDNTTPPPEEPPSSSEDYCVKWTPASYTSSDERSGVTSVLSAVKNNDASFDDWAVSNGVTESAFSGNAVYAKPGDVIDWRHCYYPGVQRTANTEATKEEGGHPRHDTSNDNRKIATFVRPWENEFTVTNKGLLTINHFESGAIGTGRDGIQSWDDEYTVQSGRGSRAGMTLAETNTSGKPRRVKINDGYNHVWSWEVSCPPCDENGCSKCKRTATHTNLIYDYSVDQNAATDTAMVKVPYNFVNTATVSLAGGSDVVYAGETAQLGSARITVHTRGNMVTKGTYATKVDGSEVRLIAYSSNSDSGSAVAGYGSYNSNLCSLMPSTHGNCTIDDYDGAGRSGTLNKNENYQSGTTESRFGGRSYNVYDVSAGEYFCVAAAVYPYTVQGNTDVQDTNGRAPWVTNGGGYSWYVSEPSCKKIAKRPSMQVWGGSLFTAGEIATQPGIKNVVTGYYSYTPTSEANTTVFGSWVEQSILAPFSPVSGLASGAATAGYGTTSRTPTAGLGGSREGRNVSFCVRSQLTMPNSTCGLMQVAGGSGSVATTKPSDKAALIARFTGSDQTGFLYDNSTAELGDTVVPIGRTWVIHRSGDFRIRGNVRYEDGYMNGTEIPKLVIYARNIWIDCGVGRVDAVLIAEEAVNTCYDSSDVNAAANANQLKINGSVIADKLVLDRTYGAATGANSMTPAEIVDYDSSLCLWGAPRSDAAASGKMLTVYQRELSPRY